MEIAIIVLAGLAVYHFVYEGILAPSFRLKPPSDATVDREGEHD